jgi:hypothetical protein
LEDKDTIIHCLKGERGKEIKVQKTWGKSVKRWRTWRIHSFIFWARQLIPWMHLSLRLIVQPLNIHSAQIQQPCAFYEEAKVSYWGCAYFFWFEKQIPKNIVALTSQRLAAANNMLHCFSLLPAESAGWIPIKQAQTWRIKQMN